MILSSPSHDTEESKEVGGSVCDCCNAGLGSEEPTSNTWCLIATTRHYLATTWHPNNSPTPSSVGYFNFTCRVEDTTPIVCSHGVARMAV